MTSDLEQYIAGYTAANNLLYPVSCGFIFLSALELLMLSSKCTVKILNIGTCMSEQTV